jgi:hypothetical protein
MMWMAAETHEIDDAALAKTGKSRAWAENALRTHDKRATEMLRRTAHGSHGLVRGAAHLTFASDATLVGATMPWSWVVIGVDLGTISGRRAVSLTDACVVAFFQQHLQGESAPDWAVLAKDFPELELRHSSR